MRREGARVQVIVFGGPGVGDLPPDCTLMPDAGHHESYIYMLALLY